VPVTEQKTKRKNLPTRETSQRWCVSSRKGPNGAPYKPIACRLPAGPRAGALAALLILIATLHRC
jgi:hypothetical protein